MGFDGGLPKDVQSNGGFNQANRDLTIEHRD